MEVGVSATGNIFPILVCVHQCVVTLAFHRLCIGRFVAKDSLFINIALILWSFNIIPTSEKPPKDEFVNTGLIV